MDEQTSTRTIPERIAKILKTYAGWLEGSEQKPDDHPEDRPFLGPEKILKLIRGANGSISGAPKPSGSDPASEAKGLSCAGEAEASSKAAKGGNGLSGASLAGAAAAKGGKGLSATAAEAESSRPAKGGNGLS